MQIFNSLVIVILAYLFFSISFFGDKLILSGVTAHKDDHKKAIANGSNPKLYVLWIGMLSIVVVVIIPFVSLSMPGPMTFIWIILMAITNIGGLYTMFVALEKFEVSRVMPTIGGLQPIFILFITWVVWGPEVVGGSHFLAFMLLFLGTVIISIDKTPTITSKFLILTIASSLLFSLNYVFSKVVFLQQDFLHGLIWTNLAIFFFSLFFLFDKDVRHQIFKKRESINKKTGLLFLSTQSAGTVASVLQGLAIYLVPVSYLAIINSLRGVQYVFLFMITLFFSIFFPKILKEELSHKIVIQKAAAIIFIIAGLVILVLY